ncbi:4-hydroxy-tetrahydrodipicolinate reductase [Buchnera aphidicola (Eriosoma grossulariae)]|uniref:4-hydroxy-tetrahydrodipicolinate reductase n=1 Tax=Buchnera aphidicola TaxID=9 RepID=UPI00346426B6
MTNTIKIAISGALGRMGSILIQEIEKNKNLKLTVALTQHHDDLIGEDVGKIINGKENYVKLSKNLKSKNSDFDILIDFTHPKNISEYIQYCTLYNKKIIIGTTGFNTIEKNIIQNAAKKIGIVLSYNFSIGMNIVYKLLQQTTKIIGKNSDIAIIETHHNKKLDKPSGTAITIKEVIQKNIQDDKKIEISSLRMGNITGDHTIIYTHAGERIEITHRAQNRTIFAHGAIQAACWLKNQHKGLFNMQDVLEII